MSRKINQGECRLRFRESVSNASYSSNFTFNASYCCISSNLDGIQNNQSSQDISFSVQNNSNIHQCKDEFEDQSSQSHSEYVSFML